MRVWGLDAGAAITTFCVQVPCCLVIDSRAFADGLELGEDRAFLPVSIPIRLRLWYSGFAMLRHAPQYWQIQCHCAAILFDMYWHSRDN